MANSTLAEVLDIRAALANQIADEFEQSGIEYTCSAVVYDFAHKRIIPLTQAWPASVKVHRQMTFRRIKTAVRSEVHKRWLKKQGS